MGLFAPFLEIPTTAKWPVDKANLKQAPKTHRRLMLKL